MPCSEHKRFNESTKLQKRKFKPITTERQFHNTGSCYRARGRQHNTAFLIEKSHQQYGKCHCVCRGAKKEKYSLLGTSFSSIFFFSKLVRAFGGKTYNKTAVCNGGI